MHVRWVSGPAPVTTNRACSTSTVFTRSPSPDGTSNTFLIGEAAGGFPICDGVGCTTPYPNGLSVHFWLVGGHSQPGWVAEGFVYSGNKCSTVERLNKMPVTDSVHDVTRHLQLHSELPGRASLRHQLPEFPSGWCQLPFRRRLGALDQRHNRYAHLPGAFYDPGCGDHKQRCY